MRIFRSAALWLLVVAFVSFGVAAGLPHFHSDKIPAHHDCFACRAQSAQPMVEPTSAVNPVPLPFLGTIVPDCWELPSQDLFTLPASRGPPLTA